MGYYIRFVFDGDERPDRKTIGTLLKEIDGGYRVEPSPPQPEDPPESVFADVYLDQDLIGALELRDVLDPGGDEEIQMLLEEIEPLDDTDAVTSTLWNATGMLCVQVLWQGGDHGESLRKLNPLWGALLARYSGVVQADEEGYYGADGTLLSL